MTAGRRAPPPPPTPPKGGRWPPPPPPARVRRGSRLVVRREGRDRGDGPEDLVGPGGRVGRHVGEHGRPVEQSLVGAALDHPGPPRASTLADAAAARELLRVDDRPELHVLAIR